MPITFSCPCGHSLTVPDSKAGARGKCPKCASPLRAPHLATAAAPNGNGAADVFDDLYHRLSSEPEPIRMVGETGSTPTQKATPPCPKCGQHYAPDVVVCTQCGINVLTGQPIGHDPNATLHERKRLKHDDDEAEIETTPFWKMTAGILLHPLATLERFPALFSRPDMLGKMTVFYAASFAAVVLAAAFMSRPGKSASDLAQIEEIERATKLEHHIPTDWVDVKSYTQGRTEWGQPFAYKILEPLGPIDAGQPFNFRVLITEPNRKDPAIGEARIRRTIGHGSPPEKDFVPLKPGAQPGEYAAQLDATRDGMTSFCFEITDRPDTESGRLKCLRGNIHVTWKHNPGWGRLVLEDRREREAENAKKLGLPAPGKESPGGVLGAAIGTAGAIGAVVANIIGLLISAVLFTAVARILGGGGSFLLMLVTMGYLTGFANFLQVLVLATPAGVQLWLQAALLFYGFLLQLGALMKVYDIDLLAALLTTVGAWAAKLLGGAYLAFAVLKIFG